MGNETSSPLDAANQVVILAFDLVEAEAKALPGQLHEALTSPPVQNAIRKTLLDFAGTRVGASSTLVSSEDAMKLLTALRSGVQDPAERELLSRIKKTAEFRRLEAGIQAFKGAAESSALGVWIDKHRNVLYLVGAAVVVGTSTVLYVTKTGGTLVNEAVDPLEGKKFEVLQVGSLTIKASLWDFRPDARVLGARVFATKTWNKVSLDLKLGVLAEGAAVKQAEGEAVVKSGPFSVAATGTTGPSGQQVNLGLKLGYSGRVGAGQFNIGVGAMYQDQQLSGTMGASYKTGDVTVGLKGSVGPQKDGGGTQYSSLLTVTIPL